jgi:hypothetical protein
MYMGIAGNQTNNELNWFCRSYQGTHLLGVNKDEFTNTVNLAIERGAQLLEGTYMQMQL